MGKSKELEADLLRRTNGGAYRRFSQYFQVKIEFDRLARFCKGKQCVYDALHADSTAHLRLAEKIMQEESIDCAEVIDVGCGSGLSGLPFIMNGHTVDGIDISRKLSVRARPKGYRKIYHVNIATDTLDLPSYDLGVSCGLLGDWVPAGFALPKIIGLLKQRAVLGITAEVRNTDLDEVLKILTDHDFKISRADKERGHEGPAISLDDYYFIVGSRN